jgi:hypothetical protein
MLPPVKITNTTVVNSILAEGCISHAHQIEGSVIGIRTRIGKDSVIVNSYIMGCDYYITKQLVIYFDDVYSCSVVLETDRCYYSWSYDEDEIDYEKKVSEYKKRVLTPVMNPIVIYEDHRFKTATLESKYKKLIEDELLERGKKWDEIVQIVKEEERYERE